MPRKLYFLIFISLIGVIVFHPESEKIYATLKDKPPSFEEKFAEVGYISADAAVEEFKNYCNCDVKLPQITPSIQFTHKFGKFFEDKRYGMDHSLNIMFVNEEKRNNIYKIQIRPLKNKLSFEGKEYTLNNGNKAIYFEHQIFNFFVFEENDLQYILGIHKDVSNNETPNTFIQIANSVEQLS